MKNAASILHPLFHHDDVLAQWMMQSSSSFQLSSGLSFSFLPLQFPIVQMSKSLWSPFSSQEQVNPTTTTTTTLSKMDDKHQRRRRLRIGIVGGGIMGITVANSLLLKKKNNNNNNMTNDVDIIVYEGDENGPGSGMDEFHANRSSPSYWRAATARNANTIAVGAAMHVFATRSVIWGVLTDVTQKAIRNLKKHLSTNVTPSLEGPMDSVLPAGATTIDDFNVEPPYFGVHLSSCMGWNVPSDERMAFGRFLSTFLYTALVHGGQDASKHRGQTLMQLAKASRHVFLSKNGMQQYSCTSNSYTEGILAIHRTPESAQHTLQECHEFQEDARAVSWEEALEYEPRLANIPTTNPLYAVLRLHDIAASCEEYMRRLLVDTRRRGVSYETKKVTNINYTNGGGYTLTFDTGESTEVDILVLAAGSETPLLAHQLGVGRYVPIYPLRGYSYTVINDRDSTTSSWWSGHSKNMLQTAFTMDRMYMSSVKPWMARVTGFAELAGFRNSAQDSPSVEAPLILTRYAKALFGGSKDTTTTTTTKEEKKRTTTTTIWKLIWHCNVSVP
eukprot:scaffold7100_cov95-Cylindrotheca_fusiformis.AAC.6